MNERIKKIRKKNGLSQEAFGKKLEITKASVSRIEAGINNPSDQTIRLICSSFNINENWLRTGEGEPRKSKNGAFSEILSNLEDSDDDFIKDLITVYVNLDGTSKKALRELAKGMAENYKKQD